MRTIQEVVSAVQQRRLSALAQAVSVATGDECPECGHHESEDNGESGRWLEYRCCACDHRWGPGTEA